MRIIELHVENFKRLKAITIRPGADGLVKITGRNAQGKSSAIDAIWAALQGASVLKDTPKPVRDGQDKAEIRLDLGRYIVTRNWSKTGNSYLTVTVNDGEHAAKISSPQKLLDSLVGDLCFDPLAFTRLKDKPQADAVMALLGLDITEIDAERTVAYDARTMVNRDLKRAKDELSMLPQYGDIEPVDTAALMRDLEAAQAQERDNADKVAAVGRAKAELKDATETFKILTEELAQSTARVARGKEAVVVAEKIMASISEPDTGSIKAKIDSASEVNQKAAMNRRYVEAEKASKKLQAESDQLTTKIDGTYKAKQEAIAAAKMPVVGLSLDLETGLLVFNGTPFKQASRSEQLRVAVVMAMAQNPELRVMRIEDASILDSEAMAMLQELAAEHDYQLWLEIVDESGKIGVHIEDGEIVDAPPIEDDPMEDF